MLNKLISLTLIVLMVLGLFAGCKGGDDDKVDVVESVSFDKQEITLTVGEKADIHATVLPEEAEDAKLVWESSNESVATVSRGRVKAISVGTAFITATSENGKYAICYVTVKEKEIEDPDGEDPDDKEDPVDPEKPGDEKPEQPDTPDNPDTPDDPENPDTPDEDEDPVEVGSNVGNKRPAYSLPLVDGSGEVNVNDFLGKKVVINFWGTWCGPCKQELPDFDEIATDYDGEVVVLAIHTSFSSAGSKDYIEENYSSSNIIFAYDVPMTEYTDTYYTMLGGANSYPRTVIIDEKGIILFTKVGMTNYNEISSVLGPVPEKPDYEDPEHPDIPVDPNPGVDVDHTLTITTEGGMAISNLPVYVFEYENGQLGDMISYGTTDNEGRVTITLNSNRSYAVRVDYGLPEGYIFEDFYPITSTNLEITVSTAILPDAGTSGLSYEVGSVMHDFTVTTTTGESFTLSEVLKEKKAVLINFWYTECAWCELEFPLIQEAYEKYQNDLAIIALDPAEMSGDIMIDVSNYQSSYDLTFDMAIDYEGLYSAFGVEGYPTSVMIDRYGVITMLHPGAITSERVFEAIFDFFTKDDYKQQLVYDYNDIIPDNKPNVQMPSSEEISQVFDGGNISGIDYLPYPEIADEYERENSWPFIIDSIDVNGKTYDVIKSTNAQIDESFSQLVVNIPLEAGDAIAFDYFSSTELGSDILYVVVNGKDIYSISGISEDWQTCYAYVAEDSATYQIGFVYFKDSSVSTGDDTIFLKDLRILSADEIDSPTCIYRYALGVSGDYADIFLGEDGYYHVDSADGPILLADLMGYTKLNPENTMYGMAYELYYDYGNITSEEYYSIINYCNYASNSKLNGICPVTIELGELLDLVAGFYGSGEDNEWLGFCCYYDAYGTDGKQLEDPIKGLAPFSAYEVILSEKGDTDFPNSFVYDRLIMPRGYLARFTPGVSGTYLISSYASDPNLEGYGLETNAWIFTEEGLANREAWYTYENVDKLNTTDCNNCYMIVYLEAGQDYYIDIAFYDVYQTGTVNYRVERLGGEGYYRFSLASPGYFVALDDYWNENIEIIAGGIDVVLGDDGIWREKRPDDREGSILYADFTSENGFMRESIINIIDKGAFDFTVSVEDKFILDCLALNDNDPVKCDEYLRQLWADGYDENAEIYKIEDVFGGIYHGVGEDCTDEIVAYLDKIITTGFNEMLDEEILEGDPRVGCVALDAALAEILQLLMDKYTFEGVENSWTKLCYYEQYFCSATPK